MTADASPPLAKPSRLGIVDGLRGYALFGLFLVHMTGYFELYNARPTPSLVQDGVLLLFLGKSFTLLAICFGFSFFIMMDGARRRGQPFAGRFAWRLGILFVVGWLHSLIYRGDIIAVLATAGFLLIPFDRVRSTRLLLILAAFLLLQPFLLVRIVAGHYGAAWALADPFFYNDGGAMRPSLFGSFGELVQANYVAGKVSKWSYYLETGRIVQILGLYLIGLVLGRERFFAEPERFARLRLGALIVAALVIVPLVYARHWACCYRHGPYYWTDILLAGWLDIAGMAISLLLFVQLWLWGSGRLLERLIPAGRMTLTLYIAQSLVFVPVYYGFGLHLWDRITQIESLLLGIAAFAVQLIFATFWFRYFLYGPLEWLWRAATKLSLDVPFRRAKEPLKAQAT
ncbi:DUF418 domain-containing protein [Sphingomonas sp. ASY06-1R]|uniref:DUF418 domain-containing protein n=1 Tax=Sphingomonas sp. ASY06-1R TaxID=3445771 RepID=UPI003FA22129